MASRNCLRGPQGCRMLGYVIVQNSKRADFHHHKYIQDAEACRDDREEIAGDKDVRVISHEGCPVVQIASRSRVRTAGPVLLHRAWRDQNAKFLSDNSSATRSRPHVGLSRAISTINR